MSGPRRLVVRCVCGWETVGSEDEVVVAAQEHGRKVHNMHSTRDQVLALARPAGRGRRTG
jgi:predicted small metal-binding protein